LYYKIVGRTTILAYSHSIRKQIFILIKLSLAKSTPTHNPLVLKVIWRLKDTLVEPSKQYCRISLLLRIPNIYRLNNMKKRLLTQAIASIPQGQARQTPKCRFTSDVYGI